MGVFEKRKEALAWLQTQFPATFPKQPVPLKIGIHQDIIALALADMPKMIHVRRALRHYVGSPHYLREMITDKPRIDLKGEQAGTVSELEATQAKERLANYHKKKAKPARPPKKKPELAKQENKADEETPVFGRRLTLKKHKEVATTD